MLLLDLLLLGLFDEQVECFLVDEVEEDDHLVEVLRLDDSDEDRSVEVEDDEVGKKYFRF